MRKALFSALLALAVVPAVRAELGMRDGKVLPFKRTDVPLEEFTAEVASAVKLRITYEKGTIRKDNVLIHSSRELSTEELLELYKETLADFGLTGLSEAGGMRIINSRDIRYNALKLYRGQNFPKGMDYIFYHYSFKNPIARDFTNSVRPFISRYARVIEFSGGTEALIQDYGRNISGLLNIAQTLDTEENFKAIWDRKKKSAEDENKEVDKGPPPCPPGYTCTKQADASESGKKESKEGKEEKEE